MDLASINASRLLTKFMPLIYKTIHRLNISPKHMNYEDFIQELQIKLLELYRSFDGDPLDNEVDRFKFTAYAGIGLYWRGIDLLKNKTISNSESMEDEKLELLLQKVDAIENIPEQNHILKDFFRQAKDRLSEDEYLLFLYLTEGEFSITEIAEALEVSRGTIYKRKEKIRNKLEDLKGFLKN